MKIEILRKLITWEQHYLMDRDEHSIVRLFQDLIDTGDIQHMELYYQRTARTLIEHGLCYRPEIKVVK